MPAPVESEQSAGPKIPLSTVTQEHYYYAVQSLLAEIRRSNNAELQELLEWLAQPRTDPEAMAMVLEKYRP
ncbi:uncharacterized protein LDX57_006680 [Aspergillus melleus]|uniref:uncharacterized protein n=1 Tax=Aspergillus melleus TaxID=138277 RepID=UPI001E8CD022|nr:uncharacterized protein LDX57_006680 [Aspergillus melleus]KAH8429009.1 hypothetical protein LDX57_006680 [Aspergillus melleus]